MNPCMLIRVAAFKAQAAFDMNVDHEAPSNCIFGEDA